jgi:hypothetical protein
MTLDYAQRNGSSESENAKIADENIVDICAGNELKTISYKEVIKRVIALIALGLSFREVGPDTLFTTKHRRILPGVAWYFLAS